MSTPTLPGARPRDVHGHRTRYRVSDLDYARARDAINLHRARIWHTGRGHALGRCEAGGVVPSAAGLLTAAARLLPAGDRARYGEEYRSELWDLARSGAGRVRQLGYALRQLRRAFPAGVALRSARRRSAARLGTPHPRGPGGGDGARCCGPRPGHGDERGLSWAR
jgi:hypothetical protein